MRLAGEDVVTRTTDGRYLPTPLTVELADELFGARCLIELGVADACVGHIPDDDLAVLDDYATRLATIVARDEADLAEFLDASHGYHCHFVGLGGSPQLRRHLPPARDLDALAAGDRRSRTGARSSTSPTTPRSPRACRDGDVDLARGTIRDHTQQVRRLVRDLIDQAGGAL